MLASFLFLALTSQWLIKYFMGLTFILFGSRNLGIKIYSLIFLPGTLIHEISHFLMASLLNVRTGKITLFPEESETEKRIRLGSVEVEKTDFIRSSLIGFAPVITGTIILIIINNYLLSQNFLDLKSWNDLISLIQNNLNLKNSLLFYLIIAVSNTLYSSREDARSWPAIVILAAITLVILGFMGLLSQSYQFFDSYASIPSQRLTGVYFLTAILNIIIVLGLLISGYLLQRILKRRIVYK